jgi:hypothetical protein
MKKPWNLISNKSNTEEYNQEKNQPHKKNMVENEIKINKFEGI